MSIALLGLRYIDWPFICWSRSWKKKWFLVMAVCLPLFFSCFSLVGDGLLEDNMRLVWLSESETLDLHVLGVDWKTD